MNSFWLLIKINLTQLFVGSFSSGSTNKKRKITNIILFGFLFLYVSVTFGIMAYSMGEQLVTVGMQKILVTMAFLIGSAMIFVQVFFSCFNVIFKAKDYEQLACLPIKQITIVLSKLISLLIYCYVFAFVFFSPIIVIYFYFNGLSLLPIIYSILGFVLLPLFPMFIAMLFSFVINALTVRLKNKNIINTIIFFVFFIAIFFVSQQSSNLIISAVNNSQNVYSLFLNLYFPNYFISKAIVDGSFVNFIYYFLLSVLPIVLLGALFTYKYKKLYSYFSMSAKTKAKIFVSKSTSLQFALMKKEISRIFSSPMVLLNSCIGPLMLIITALMSFGDAYTSVNSIYSGFVIALVLVPAVNMISNPTSTSFSLEGNSFWLLKNLPISLFQIIIGKVVAMFVLFAIPNIIGLVLLSIAFKFGFLQILVLICLSLLSIMISALIGVIINLHKCNIHWSNEILVVKQSASTLINLAIGMAVSILPILLYVFVLSFLSSLIYGLFIVILYIVLAICLAVYLKKNAEKLFKKIN